MSKSIRLNPSWAACGRILLEVVKHGDSEQARADAEAEIIRALKGYDAMLEKHTDYFEPVEIDNSDAA